MKNPLSSAAWLILLLALLLRVGYMVATPDYVLVHDALDYDKAATSIATRRGLAVLARPRAARRRSARPPTRTLLAAVYKVGRRRARASEHARVVAGAHARHRHRDA